MRTFYTASDIEDLAASGVTRLEVGPGVTLTAAAKDMAQDLGIVLTAPGPAADKSAAGKPASTMAVAAAPKSGGLPARPRGCQHGLPGPATSPAPAASPAAAKSAAGASPVVEQLVEAVSALKKKGA